MTKTPPHIVVIGAGIGGLSCALRLSGTGAHVTVLERHATPGGKMRTVPSVAGPVDAGPTVLTMKPVFEALFSSVGERIEDHVTLHAEPILARHFWADGTTLDLMADTDHSRANIADVLGDRAAQDYARFAKRARDLFDAFDAPMMQSAEPSVAQLTAQVLKNPKLIPAIAPHQSFAKSLTSTFSEPKLAQLFARYATYVGGLPAACPAVLALISHAEAQGVWHVEGGMHILARTIETLAALRGVEFHYDAHVTRIETQGGHPVAVYTSNTRHPCDAVVFNGDPQAMHDGLLGSGMTSAVPNQTPRSLSAYMHAFAGDAYGFPLAAHNVFFADDPAREYDPLAHGRMQDDPTLYVCAQDRFAGRSPRGPERFEIIMNAAPTDYDTPNETERHRCQTRISHRLAQFGLDLTPPPDTLTMPAEFNAMFPASRGALYGRSPHGMMAAFNRPAARTPLSGVYLTGGGAHPGAGLPMATLSAMHAAEAIAQDLTLSLQSRPKAMRGGMSTASPTIAAAPSRSLGS